jgi:hypothetical protein
MCFRKKRVETYNIFLRLATVETSSKSGHFNPCYERAAQLKAQLNHEFPANNP